MPQHLTISDLFLSIYSQSFGVCILGLSLQNKYSFCPWSFAFLHLASAWWGFSFLASVLHVLALTHLSPLALSVISLLFKLSLKSFCSLHNFLIVLKFSRDAAFLCVFTPCILSFPQLQYCLYLKASSLICRETFSAVLAFAISLSLLTGEQYCSTE